MKDIAEVLRDLVQPSNVAIRSNAELVGDVAAAAAQDDKEREEKQLEALRRKPGLKSIPTNEIGPSLQLTPWDVLHTLGRALALSRKGAGRGLAEHWGCLKYSQALTGSPGTFMALSAEGRDTADYYKAIQSGELGVGFALVMTRHVLARRYPDHNVSIIAADTALRAGFALTGKDSGPRVGYRYRPQFFAEVWKPGQPSRAFPIVCRGNHSGAATSHTQLAAAAIHVEAVHIGGWDETPALVFSTELPMDGPLSVHALHTPGNSGRLAPAVAPDLDKDFEEKNIYPGIQPPAESDRTPEPEPGFHIQPEHYGWFQHVLARTAAAGLTAFSGDGDATVHYLTKRQGQHRFAGLSHAAIGSVQDAHQTLLGIPFVGTDHVFRLNRTRVEAFSGVARTLFDHLAKRRLTQDRTEVHERRSTWPAGTWDPAWEDGPVSVHPDGSVLALRVLPN